MKKMLKKAKLNTKKKTKAQVAFLNNHIFIYINTNSFLN